VHPSKVVPVTEYVVLIVGLTVFVAPAPNEPLQLNVVPVISELAVSSVLAPKQISFGFAVAVIVGNGLTVTVTSAVPVHPAKVVPVTVYVVVEVGLTVTVGLVPRELDQLNVVLVISELAVSSVLAPKQISFGFAVAVIVGNGLTVTVTSAVPVHPAKVVPVTVYVVVEVGLTVTVGLVPRELDQLNVVLVISELAVSSVLAPKQISFGVADAVVVGKG